MWSADDGVLQDVSVLQFKRDRVCVKRDLLTDRVKQSKKAKNCAVFCFAGKSFFFIFMI
jgi:hypothetical protein